jgi:hypothetical protein
MKPAKRPDSIMAITGVLVLGLTILKNLKMIPSSAIAYNT